MYKLFADWLTYQVFRLEPRTILAEAVDFFIYDTLKIFTLLFLIIFVVSFIRTFFPPEKTKRILSHEKQYIGNIVAALLGIVTPFCTCSAIPLFLGFIEAGIPLGVTFSFLISSPMINEVALVVLWGMFGWKIALIYIGSGLIIAITAGIIIGKLKLEHLVQKLELGSRSSLPEKITDFPFRLRLVIARDTMLSILKHIWLFVLIAIGIGAWIHGFVPADFLSRYAGRGTWYAVPLAVLIGVPLYGSCAGALPLIGVLTEKGVGLGTALAFMMAVTALSLPEFLILKKVMKLRLIIIFASVVGLGIIFTGYMFNYIFR
jgi:hypothetical protein